MELSDEALLKLLPARPRRRLSRGLNRRAMSLLKKLRKSRTNLSGDEKPRVVKTHLRDMVILPEMVGCIVGVYSGKVFNAVEIKTEMIGHYLGEFSLSYTPVRHGKPGIGATNSSKGISLK